MNKPMNPEAKSYHKEFGKRLKFARIAAGLRQEDIGERLNLTFQQIQKYEKGENRLNPFGITIWAELTRFPLGYFFDQESEVPEMKNDKNNLRFQKNFDKLSSKQKRSINGIINSLAGE